MSPGAYISGAGHAALILWALFGIGLNSDPLEFEVMDVSIVTGDEFAAMTSGAPPAAPQVEAPEPPAPQAEEAPETEAPTPEPDVAPETSPAPPPVPEAAPAEETPVVPETQPVPPPAELADEAPDAPVQPDVAQVIRDPSLNESARPRPRPVERVAPTPIAPPPPDAAVSDTVTEAAEADPDIPAEEVVEEPAEEASPEEAASEIVTEAEEPASSPEEEEVVTGAPATSRRPLVRPNRPAPEPDPAPEPETRTAEAPEPETPQTPPSESTASSDNVEDAIAAAVAEAAASASSASSSNAQTEGPPLSGAEQEGFRVAVQGCWNVDVGSEASGVSITVSFSLNENGTVSGDVRRVGAQGGSAAAQDAAFQAARRAVLRCQSANGRTGYDLPAEKYGSWRNVEMTFDPSGMRLR